MKLFLMTISLAFLLIGCSSTPKKLCTTSDWTIIGYENGKSGLPRDQLTKFGHTCSASPLPNEQVSYDQAWIKGHSEFCSPESGYRTGVHGKNFTTTCDPREFPEFNEQYRLGVAVNQLRRQRYEIDHQISEINQDTSTLATIARAGALLNGTSPTADLDQRKAHLDEKIMAIDQNAPGGPQAQSTTDLSQYLSQPDLIKYTGALFGSVFGFGIGHAIQGRYQESGWKWTLGEVATLGTLATVSASACGDSTTENIRTQRGETITYEKRTLCAGNGPGAQLLPVALLTWLGFRVWQSYDLFSEPKSVYAQEPQHPHHSLYASADGVIWLYQF